MALSNLAGPEGEDLAEAAFVHDGVHDFEDRFGVPPFEAQTVEVTVVDHPRLVQLDGQHDRLIDGQRVDGPGP